MVIDGGWSNGKIRIRVIGRLCFRVFPLALVLFMATAAGGCHETLGQLPENPGYLRASSPRLGSLTIFDSDTFEVYRTVELPDSWVSDSHRLEIDPMGRIWIAYTQDGMDRVVRRWGVLVFSPEGDLEHELDLGCAPPDSGIAFANGFAFVACAASGFSGKVYVVDLQSMELVKSFDRVHPPGEDPSKLDFYINAVAEVGGYVLVVGFGNPPRDYPRLTNHSATYTRVGVIDPETLTFRGYLTGVEPGLRVQSVLDIDGKAWLFNELSHLEEHAPRTDVYVMDPETVEIVDRFNLGHPFPIWAVRPDEETVYVYHRVRFTRLREAGYLSGVTKLNLATWEETFIPSPRLIHFKDMAVYQGIPCLTYRTQRESEDSGLWCLNEAGELEQKIHQDYAIGILFPPSADG